MPGRPGGYAEKPLLVRQTGKTLSSHSAVCDLGQRRTAVHDLRKRLSAALFIEFLRRLITNYPKKIFLVVDGIARTQGTVGASLA